MPWPIALGPKPKLATMLSSSAPWVWAGQKPKGPLHLDRMDRLGPLDLGRGPKLKWALILGALAPWVCTLQGQTQGASGIA